MSAVIVNILGQNWFVDRHGWKKVPADAKLEDYHTPEVKSIQPVVNQTIEIKVASSKPGSYYTVTKSQHHYSCTCRGYEFRSRCRHIDEIKEKYD
jgi:predicted SprT family Zn-dependent metalloprotease